MSSQTDIQAYDAKIARLEAQLQVQDRMSASRIRELEQKVMDLELDKQMSTPRPSDQATQPEPFTSDFATLRAENSQLRAETSQLRAENSQLRDLLATKGATIVQQHEAASHLRTTVGNSVARFDELYDGMVALNKSWSEMILDVDKTRQEGRNVYDYTRVYEKPSFDSLQNDTMRGLMGDTAQVPSQTASSSRRAKPAANAASGPSHPSAFELRADEPAVDPVSRSSASPASFGFSAVRPAADAPLQPQPSAFAAKPTTATVSGPKQSTGRVRRRPHRFQTGGTHASFSAKKEAERQGPSEPQKQHQQQSQKPNRVLGHGSQRGGWDQSNREDPRRETGSLLHSFPSNMHPLTLKQAKSAPIQATTSVAKVKDHVEAGALPSSISSIPNTSRPPPMTLTEMLRLGGPPDESLFTPRDSPPEEDLWTSFLRNHQQKM